MIRSVAPLISLRLIPKVISRLTPIVALEGSEHDGSFPALTGMNSHDLMKRHGSLAAAPRRAARRDHLPVLWRLSGLTGGGRRRYRDRELGENRRETGVVLLLSLGAGQIVRALADRGVPDGQVRLRVE